MSSESPPPAVVRRVEHEGATIHIFDFSRAASAAELLARIASAHGALDSEPAGSVLTLVDVREAPLDPEVVSALGALAVANAPYVAASAVVGAKGALEGARQLIAGLTDRDFEPFADLGEALDWLAAT